MLHLVSTKTVGALGRIVIPDDIRSRLGMETGTTVDLLVDDTDGVLVIRVNPVHRSNRSDRQSSD